MWAQFRRGWHILIFTALSSLCSLTDSQWHKDGLEEVRCPTYIGNAPCDCLAASDGLDFTCNAITRLADIRAVVSAARFAIKTLTLAPLSPNVTCLCDKIFANGSVSELKIVGSNLEDVDEHAFDASPPIRLQTLILKDARLAKLPRAQNDVTSVLFVADFTSLLISNFTDRRRGRKRL